MVERDGGRERGEPGGKSDAEVVEGARAVALEGEDVLAGLEDRFDPLADRREVWDASSLVFAAWSHDRRFQRGQFGLEVLAAEVLVADQNQRLSGCSFAAGDHLYADELLVDLRGGERQCSGVPSGANRACSRNPQK